jgi:ribosomal peptide maturation radical SAM protein 1
LGEKAFLMPFKLALVCMPWPLADRPSIQIAALKAYIEQQHPGTVSARAFHPYLGVAAALGSPLYQTIAARSWLAEAIYASLRFPQQLKRVQDLVRRLGSSRHGAAPLDVAAVGDRLRAVHEQSRLFEQLAEANLVGISVCLAQLTASLYLAQEVKRRSPSTPIVLGGSMVCGRIGRSLLETFPEIDYIVNGEGEKPLAALTNRLLTPSPLDPQGIPGLLSRNLAGAIRGQGMSQVSSLDSLPFPEFSDYFSELRHYPALGNMIGQLPLESSRGCYWHQATPAKPQQACQFCNLNLQWRGYRARSPERVARELSHQARKYRSQRFFFVDNTLNPATLTALFKEIQQLGLSLDLFAELRAPVSRRHFQDMRLAGVRHLQIGIEAVSGRLLAKMHKGTRVIENIEMMKRCEEFGISNLSNLLVEFPGSDQRDVDETLAALEFVRCYQPLRLVRFWLGEGSPIHFRPELHGLRAVGNHPWYRELFPPELLARLVLLQKTYRGDRALQAKLWRPVRRGLQQWRREYHAGKRRHPNDPLLGYSDGGSFLIVRRRDGGSDSHEAFRFAGKSAAIYRYCDVRRTLADIERCFPGLRPLKLEQFLGELVAKRLMYQEGQEYLSLAVDEDIRRFQKGSPDESDPCH